MRPNGSQIVWVVLAGATFFVAAPAHGQIWKQFMPSSRASETQDARATAGMHSNTQRTNEQDRQSMDSGGAGDFQLKQESGPWLIVAASFSGNGAAKQAHDLAQELR